MFIDDKGKLFGKISIVDLFVILVIVVAIVGSVIAFGKVKGGEVLTENKAILSQDSTLDKLEVRLRLKEVRSMTKDAIHIGDGVYTKDTGKYLGEVIGVETEPAKRIITGNDGRAAEIEVPERMDVIMILEVAGKRTDDGYFTGNNIHLVYDSSFEIVTPTIESTPTIDGIAVIEE